MSDDPGFDENSVAGALCLLAVQGWANDYRDHIEKAAVAYEQCCSGFANVAITDEGRDAFLKMLAEMKGRKK